MSTSAWRPDNDTFCYDCKCRAFEQQPLKRTCGNCAHDINHHEFRSDDAIREFAAQEFAKHGQI